MKTIRLRWGIILVAVVAAFPLFLHLDSPPIKLWDESLYAMRAYYLAEEGGYLPNFSYFPGGKDHHNLKPPFGTALQALSYRCFGYTELALRLPVALFGLGTILLLAWGVGRATRQTVAGVAAGLILAASAGFVRMHGTRTGDHDVILAFWMLLAVLSFYRACETLHRKWIWAAAASLLLGFLTKSVSAFFFLPGFLLYALLHKRVLPLLKQRATYGALALLIGGITSYYVFMEWQLPGFWGHVQDHVFGRVSSVIDGHQHPMHYYLNQIAEAGFFPWLWLLPLTLLQLKRKDRFQHLLWLSLISHLVIISIASTKLSWYSLPVYPLAAGLLGIAFGRWMTDKRKTIRWTTLILGVGVWGLAYAQIVHWASNYQVEGPEEKMALMLRKVRRERPALKRLSIYTQDFDGQASFYAQLLNEQYGYDIQVYTYWEDKRMHAGDHLLVCIEEKIARAQSVYDLKPLLYYDECRLVQLAPKESD